MRALLAQLVLIGITVIECFADDPASLRPIKVGIIGLDTPHAVSFTQLLNDPKVSEDLAACRVVAAYPKGSPDIKSSVERAPQFIEAVKLQGVEIVGSIDELLTKVDAVLLETNDGRPHLKQVLPVLKANKPCFIDKPLAGSLADAIAIYAAAEKFATPVFTSSTLRYTDGMQKLRRGEYGEVLGCDTYGPCPLEKTHPDLFWYGIHGVEVLIAAMGSGCESVTRTTTPDSELVVGTWKDGRIGTFRGNRKGTENYGGTVFTSNGIQQTGDFPGYRSLTSEIVKFFRTRKPPVSADESLEIYAFMEAADESKRQGGKPVRLADVLTTAQVEAAKKKLD